jgi:hypothetical protein
MVLDMSATTPPSSADSEPWQCRHIRLSNPGGPGAPDVPRLLRAAADLLERIGDDIEVLDLGFRQDEHHDGPWTGMNIYYRRGAPRRPRPTYGA